MVSTTPLDALRTARTNDEVRAVWDMVASSPRQVRYALRVRLVAETPLLSHELLALFARELGADAYEALRRNPAALPRDLAYFTGRATHDIESDDEVRQDQGLAILRPQLEHGAFEGHEHAVSMLVQWVLRDGYATRRTRSDVAAALVALPTLPKAQLLRLVRLSDNVLCDVRDEIVIHPNADLDVWRALALDPAATVATLTTVADIPDARRDPDIRARLIREAEQHRSEWLMRQLVKDAAHEVRWRFTLLAALDPHAAATLLTDPEFADITRLERSDVAPLLDEDDALVRERAIAALARCEGRAPSLAEVRVARRAEADWRERLPQDIPF